MVRLFIYHVEAGHKPENERIVLQSQFKIMQRKLWFIITWPAALLSSLFGYWMVIQSDLWQLPWMKLKIGLTTLLWVYHLITHRIYLRSVHDKPLWTSNQLRLWNELATLWLVSIVFVVILRNSLDMVYGTIGFFMVGVALMIGIRIYKKVNK